MHRMTSCNSISTIDDVMNHLSLLLGLMEAQDWIEVEHVALLNPTIFKVISETISDCEEFNDMTLLHVCVRYDPPVKVLDQMIELYPQALMEEDCLGRTPLHVAAGSGASLTVIKHLTMNYPHACNIQDDDGKTPLHFACDTNCELFEDGECLYRGPPSLGTIRALLSGSLDAVMLEDVDEMNAVEYAILSDAPIEVVKRLQKAAQLIRKKAKMMLDDYHDEEMMVLG